MRLWNPLVTRDKAAEPNRRADEWNPSPPERGGAERSPRSARTGFLSELGLPERTPALERARGPSPKGSTGASRLREARGESSPRRLASEDQTGDRVFAPRRVRRDRVVSRSASEEARSSPNTSGLDPSVSLSDRSRCGDLRRDRTWRRLRGNRGFLRTGLCETNSSEELLRASPQICHPSVAAGSGSERETERPWKGSGSGALAEASCLGAPFREPG